MSLVTTRSAQEIYLCYKNTTNSCLRIPRSFGTLVGLYIVCGFAVLVIVLGNLLVIISVSHFRVLHTPSNFLCLSLALVDCLVGIIVIPFSAVRSVENCWYFGDDFCVLHSCFDTFLCLSSIFHLCFISVDRYYAVCDPLLYTTKVTLPLLCQVIAFCWIASIVYTFALLYSRKVENQLNSIIPNSTCIGSCSLTFMTLWGWINFSVLFIPCFLMLGLYVKIFMVARQQARIIDNMEKTQNTKYDLVSKREKKAAKTLGIAVGAYLFCWLPYILYSLIDAGFDFIPPPVIGDFMYWTPYLNSACNPFIYGFFYPWFRRALMLITTGKIFHKYSSNVNLYQD
ncbi:trace amine-associated receptor 7f-like [Protopterus annectens]|uniref:trace amine-associated receptor 7f-like n=1 Tax=Protopterus annectens TaxID=7888 RepID=UPI001CFBF1D8|nr:trace amine-associated receptor 7f-like [Protopterus annectens]